MEVTKVRSQILVAWEQASVRFRSALDVLSKVRARIGARVQIVREKSQEYWTAAKPHLQNAMFATREGLGVARTAFAAGARKSAAHLAIAGRALRKFGRTAGLKAGVAGRKSAEYWKAGSEKAIASARETMGVARAEVVLRSRQAAVQIEKAEHTLADAGRIAAAKAAAARRGLESELDKIESGARSAATAANESISNVRSNVSAATLRAASRVKRAGQATAGAIKHVLEKPRRLREARLAKEKELGELMADSEDGIVVTDASRRLVAANPIALDLLGISDYNMRHFTIDAFVEHAEELRNRNGHNGDRSSNQPGEESCKQRKIRRLDGGLRVADCEFLAEFVPKRHVYTFRNIGPYRLAPFGFAARRERTEGAGKAQRQQVPFPRVAREAKKLPRHGVRHVY